MLDAVSSVAFRRIGEFKPQELSSTAWAFATLRVGDPALDWATRAAATEALFEAISLEAQGRLREFGPQELASTAWAFATVGIADAALFEAVAAEARGVMEERKGAETTAGVAPAARARWFRRLFRRRSGKK